MMLTFFSIDDTVTWSTNVIYQDLTTQKIAYLYGVWSVSRNHYEYGFEKRREWECVWITQSAYFYGYKNHHRTVSHPNLLTKHIISTSTFGFKKGGRLKVLYKPVYLYYSTQKWLTVPMEFIQMIYVFKARKT